MWAEVCLDYQVWNNNASYKSTSVFVLRFFFIRPWKYEIRRSSKEWKEIGTNASLAGRCCNADDEIINVSNKFDKLWHAVWMCLFFYWNLLLFILSALIQKQEERVVLDGSKIIRIVLLRKRAIDTVDILHEIQTRRKGFSSVSLPLRHVQVSAQYEEWQDGKPSSWITNVVFGVSFVFDTIGEIPAWPR